MAYETLSIGQKKGIQKEKRHRLCEGESCNLALLASCAQKEFNLSKTPGKSHIFQILSALLSDDGKNEEQFRLPPARNEAIDKALFNWSCDQQQKRVAIAGYLIQRKGLQLQVLVNEKLSDEKKLSCKFSNGWLQRFKKRWGMQGFTLHGEAGDAELEVIVREIPSLRSLVSLYHHSDICNEDETGLFYKMAPDKTSATSSMHGRKKNKERITVLLFCNASGSERFNTYFKQRSTRTVILLIKNCSAHGFRHTLAQLSNFRVHFLPPNTTSRIQPLDAGFIRALKAHYRRKFMEHALDMADREESDIYNLDIFKAMNWVKEAWSDLKESILHNCWKVTEPLEGKKVTDETDLSAAVVNEVQTVHQEMQDMIQCLVPEHRRLSVQDLLNQDEIVPRTQIVDDSALVEGILSENADERIEALIEEMQEKCALSTNFQEYNVNCR